MVFQSSDAPFAVLKVELRRGITSTFRRKIKYGPTHLTEPGRSGGAYVSTALKEGRLEALPPKKKEAIIESYPPVLRLEQSY